MDQQLATLDDVRSKLTPREQLALERWERGRERSPIAIDVALQMYELFLNGHTCEEIHRVNKKAGRDFHLGQIVDARIRYEWDGRRDAHRMALFDAIAVKTKQAQMEAVSFMTDLLAAAHKQHGDPIKKYLQTGDIKDLGEFHVGTMTSYQNVVSMLLKLTGQDRPAGAGGAGGTQVNIIGAQSAEVKTADPKSRLNGEDVARLLQLVEGDDE
jgi:hypothetical protein